MIFKAPDNNIKKNDPVKNFAKSGSPNLSKFI